MEPRGLVDIVTAFILVVAVAINELECPAQRKGVADWQVQRALNQFQIVVTSLHPDIATDRLHLRLPCDDVHRTAAGVTTVQCSLGTFEDFHPLKVEKHAADTSR